MYQISNAGISLIKKYEGLKLNQYYCPAKISTIGYGTTLINGKSVPEGLVITEAQAEHYLIDDLKTFVAGVNSLVKSKITQSQFDSLVSFSYNVGLANLKTSTLLKKVNTDPTDTTIRTEFLKWVNASGKKLRGLELRRIDESNLYFSLSN